MDRTENPFLKSGSSKMTKVPAPFLISKDKEPNGEIDPVLGEIIEEMSDLFQAGQQPCLEDYLKKYPELEESLVQVYEVLATLFLTFEQPESSDERSSDPILGKLGDFKLLSQIGRGGMGVVYEAEQISLGRRVALKTLPLAAMLDPRQLQRFQNEARAAAMLEHPHIVGVFSVGSERGVYYYAMQFIEGRTLAEVIAETRRQEGIDPFLPGRSTTTEIAHGLPTTLTAALSAANNSADLASSQQAERSTVAAAADSSLSNPKMPTPSDGSGSRPYFQSVARLGIQAAQALEHAHQLGIVHRDIKPSNLLVNPQGHLWVTDFGLAQIESAAELTLTGDILGTLRYMSPEQAQGNHRVLDHRSDIYSLGATLYEMLTLRPVVQQRKRATIVRELLEDDPQPLRRWNRAIPRDLETIVLKALSKQPSKRYATAQDLADDLQRYLDDQPIRARRPTMLDRLGKWSRRHWAAVTTAATLLVLAGITAAGFKLQAELRLRELADSINTSIAVTRAAIDVDDLRLAANNLAEAEGKLRTAGARLPDLGDTLQQLRYEIEKREEDTERFERLIELARDAQDKMTHAADQGGDQTAEEALALLVNSNQDWRTRLESATTEAQQAVELAGVMADDNWLENASLSAEQQQQARETIYETLLCLADFGVRWDEHRNQQRARESLEYLNLASRFQQPTRGFYWVRAECYDFLENEAAAAADRRRYEQTPPIIALDHYLPGHTAGWNGDPNEAVSAYIAALTLQPGNYNAMYFLGKRLAQQRRLEEAVLAFRACIALRPSSMFAHWECSYTLARLERFDEAEQLLTSSLERAQRELGNTHPGTAQAIRNLAQWNFNRGKYAESESLCQEALDLRRNIFSEQHPEYAASLSELASVYVAMAKYDQAKPLLHESLEIHGELYGQQHPDYARSLLGMARLYLKSGKYFEAKPLVQKSLEVLRDSLGETDPEYLSALTVFVELHIEMRQMPQAMTLQRQANELTLQLFGEESIRYAGGLNNLSIIHQLMGQYAEAAPLNQKAMEITGKMLGEEHPGYATCVNNLGAMYWKMDRYDEAEALSLKALEIRRKILGETHPDYVVSLDQLSSNYSSMGDLNQAENYGLKAFEVARNSLGKEHPRYGFSLNTMAILYSSMGRYSEAHPMFLEAMEFCRITLGEEHPHYITSIGNLAISYKNVGDYASAEPLYRLAVELSRDLVGEEDVSYATNLTGLGYFYRIMGNLAQAEPLLEQAVDIRETALGEDHTLTAVSYHQLGDLRHAQGDLEAAEELFRKAINIRLQLGQQHPDYAVSLLGLGALLVDTNDLDQAQSLLQQALEIRETVLGENHPKTGECYHALAKLRQAQGDHAAAEILYRKAIEIRRELGEQHLDWAASLHGLGVLLSLLSSTEGLDEAETLLGKALEIREAVLGNEHPDYAQTKKALEDLHKAREFP